MATTRLSEVALDLGVRGAVSRAAAVAPLDGPCRDRTCDLEIKSLLLYQLS